MSKTSPISAFLHSDDGAGNAMSITWAVLLFGLAGVAIDGANAWRVQNQLQVAADAAAISAVPLLPDEAAAREMAVRMAMANLPSATHGDIVDENAIQFGVWDGLSQVVDVSAPNPDAVLVSLARDQRNGSAIPTFLLKMFGQKTLSTNVQSVATLENGPTLPTTETITPTCASATFITEDFMDTGGGNTFNGDVCLHGAKGVLTGGADYLSADMRISASSIEDIIINTPAPGSAHPDDIKVEQELKPTILPKLDDMFDARWDALYSSGITEYSGDLIPSNVFDSNGKAKVVQVNKGWWSVQPGDLEPHTIYMVNHGMQLAGGVDAQNVAIIARGQIGTGGGPGLKFQDVFFFGSGALNFSGAVEWGREANFCDTGKFNTHLFSLDSLSLGGSGTVYGVVGVAKTRFSPGGAMRASGGVYFEASEYTSLGGNMNIRGCAAPLASEFALTEQEPEEIVTSAPIQIGFLVH